MTEKRKLSLREKVDYVPAFTSIGVTACVAPITGPFRGPTGADTYKHHIAHAIIRKFNARLSSLQSQYFQPAFDDIYMRWCKTRRIQPDVVQTDSVSGFWVGDRVKAKYVVIYYHGGGFALDGSEGHLAFWTMIQDHLETAKKLQLAFFYVTYSLTPHKVFPTQLEESVAALRYIVEDCQRPPSQILLGGDSAGGNLAVAVLLHLSHPCSDIKPFTITENLKGMVLMSPWVSLDVTWPSFQTNKHRDYLEADVEGRWAKEYVVDHPHCMYTDPALAPPELWRDAKCDTILVTVGTSEVLIEGIQSWVDKYTEGIKLGQSVVSDPGAVWSSSEAATSETPAPVGSSVPATSDRDVDASDKTLTSAGDDQNATNLDSNTDAAPSSTIIKTADIDTTAGKPSPSNGDDQTMKSTVSATAAATDSATQIEDSVSKAAPLPVWERIYLFKAANEAHIAAIVWPLFGDKHETETLKEIKRWMGEYLSR